MEKIELTTPDLQALTLTGATELAMRWVDQHKDAAAIRTHLAAGAGLELLVQLAPRPALGLRMVDSDGSYIALDTFTP